MPILITQTTLKSNGNKLQISKCLVRVLLSKKEKRNAENCKIWDVFTKQKLCILSCLC